jgi:E3 ubiquitin-protein ligase DOA10
MARVEHTPASTRIFKRRLALKFLLYIFIVIVLLVLFLSALSLSIGFQILLVCFKACFARISLYIFGMVLKCREWFKCLIL